MKILLACSAGMSSSILEKAIMEYFKKNNIIGSIDAFGAETAKRVMNKYDVVLLGPQISYMLDSFIVSSLKTPIGVISPADFALANASNVVELSKKLIKEWKHE